MYYVYVLKDRRTRQFYYGYTHDLGRRLTEHSKDGAPELVYYEAYKAGADARRREQQLKHYAQALTALQARIKDSIW